LNINHELGGNADNAKLVCNSRASELGRRFEVHRVGDPLFCGLKSKEIHRILSMKSEEK